MALPKLNALPQYEVTIPSTNKVVKYRPFLVKEQKVLLMALETQDQRAIYNAMVDVITACVEDNTSLSNLTTYDVEYMFLMIRSKSVGETIQLKMGCSEDHCDVETPANIVIDDIDIPNVESTTTIIELEPGISIELEHPSIIRAQETTTNSKDVTEGTLALMKAAIKNVLTEEERIVFKDESVKEQDEFIENLKTTQLDQIYKFVSSIPTMEYDLEWTCDGCGNNNQRKLRGLADFF